MYSFLQKSSIFIILATVLLVSPLYAQQQTTEEPQQSFIQKGEFLTGFSLSFINASRDDFNQEFEREFTHIAIQLEGLYFVSEQIGIGPLLGYRFTYRDLEDPFRGPDDPDLDTRTGRFEFGARGGWFIPAAKIFGGAGDAQFFVNGGASYLRKKSKWEGSPEPDANYRFGYRLGTGFLFPVGKRIALETKLGFQARQQKYSIGIREPGGEITNTTETRWLKELALSVGFKVTF